jgi:hypothetical protein
LADRKISQLTNLTGADLADVDEFAVVDASATETKAITFGELKTALDTSTGFVRITGDTMTGDLGVPNITASGTITATSFSGDGSSLTGIATDVVDDTTPQLGGNLDTNTHDILFGDNDKAVFGAGSDLQIYHDGTRSYISDQGTGILRILTDAFQVMKPDESENLIYSAQDGYVRLYHNGSAKLETTATGIDVTGTVTADGLTVSNTGTGSTISVERTDGSAFSLSAGVYSILGTDDATNLYFKTNNAFRQLIASNGDISFYEDTGTTPKFFWDASAERLGIGTTSPEAPLDIVDTSIVNKIKLRGVSLTNNTEQASIIFTDSNGAVNSEVSSYRGSTFSDGILTLKTASGGTLTERMRIDSSGNVVIGASSVSNPNSYGAVLNVEGYAPALVLSEDTGRDYTIGVNGNNLNIFNETTNVLTILDSGNVGIGTSSPSTTLDVAGQMSLSEAGANSRYIKIGVGRTGNNFSYIDLIGDTTYTDFATRLIRNNGGANTPSALIHRGTGPLQLTAQDAGSVAVLTNGSERMRIDSSGNLLVGKTTTNSNTVGTGVFSSGLATFCRDGAEVVYVNRKTSDGELIRFAKDGSTVGSIKSISSGGGGISIDNEGSEFNFDMNGGVNSTVNSFFVRAGIYPFSDNYYDVGRIANRWDDIYANNGTIQTSDRNEKQDIEALSDAEQRVAVAAKGLLRKYRWKDAVAEKGDAARIHFGIIAQDLQAAFEAEGLDAGRYGMFISSTWWEATETYTDDEGVEQIRTNTYETQEEAPEGATERTRMGVRYPELLAFIIAAL